MRLEQLSNGETEKQRDRRIEKESQKYDQTFGESEIDTENLRQRCG
jgi:hypothetical protein